MAFWEQVFVASSLNCLAGSGQINTAIFSSACKKYIDKIVHLSYYHPLFVFVSYLNTLHRTGIVSFRITHPMSSPVGPTTAGSHQLCAGGETKWPIYPVSKAG